MSYRIREGFPNYNLVGIYPSGSDSQLGLDSIDLETFSLGNWEEYKRNDVQLLVPLDIEPELITLLPGFSLDELAILDERVLNDKDRNDNDVIHDPEYLVDGGDRDNIPWPVMKDDINGKHVSIQSSRFSPDGTKLFVLTKQVMPGEDMLDVDTDGVWHTSGDSGPGDGSATWRRYPNAHKYTVMGNTYIDEESHNRNNTPAKRILTYELPHPFTIPTPAYYYDSTIRETTTHPIMDQPTNIVDFSLYEEMNWVIVDFHISSEEIIFLTNNQPKADELHPYPAVGENIGTQLYSPTSDCKLVSFSYQADNYDLSSLSDGGADAGTIRTQSVDDCPNAKSFDITPDGEKLFILYGTSPLYITGYDPIDDSKRVNIDTCMHWKLVDYRLNTDVDFVQGYNLSEAFNIDTMEIDSANKREIFKRNPDILSMIPPADTDNWDRNDTDNNWGAKLNDVSMPSPANGRSNFWGQPLHEWNYSISVTPEAPAGTTEAYIEYKNWKRMRVPDDNGDVLYHPSDMDSIWGDDNLSPNRYPPTYDDNGNHIPGHPFYNRSKRSNNLRKLKYEEYDATEDRTVTLKFDWRNEETSTDDPLHLLGYVMPDASNERYFQGEHPTTNPIYMEGEPFFEERSWESSGVNDMAGGGHNFKREIGALCPKTIRIFPALSDVSDLSADSTQQMIISGMVVTENFRESETHNSQDSYTHHWDTYIASLYHAKSQTYNGPRHDGGTAFNYTAFQYNLGEGEEYDIQNSIFVTKRMLVEVDGAWDHSKKNSATTWVDEWKAEMDLANLNFTFFDLNVNPRMAIVAPSRGGHDSLAMVKISTSAIIPTIVSLFQLEEENIKTFESFFADPTDPLYQKWSALVNIPGGVIDPPEYVEFKVIAITDNNPSSNETLISIPRDDLVTYSNLLHYDINDPRYSQTSYPTKVLLGMDLFDENGLDDNIDLNYDKTPTIADWLDPGIRGNSNDPTTWYVDFDDFPKADSLFFFKVLQWGDEKVLWEADELKDIPYFLDLKSDVDNETFDTFANKWFYMDLQTGFIPMRPNSTDINFISHVYNTPGAKSVKIVVLRYSKNKQWIVETSLHTKQIIINDGNLLAQDFEIFGGTDFNFLPLQKENQAIIGGLDEDSNYNNSVEKIVQNDNFIQEDYLERITTNDFISNFNSSLYGKHLGQVDLGINRVFKGSHDIYDFLNLKSNVMNEIIGSSFPSFDDNFYTLGDDVSIETSKLEINSEATDIFINDNKNSSLLSDCLIELVPSEREYLTIPNEIGTDAKAILIGDYEVEQPAGGKINKKGIMKTPMLEQKRDKQAF